jgi:D-inositol-3-phosphate glycosyltransferase
MKIVYVGPVPPFRGGISQYGARLYEAFLADGHEVDLRSWKAQYPRLLYHGEQHDPLSAPLAAARFDLRWWDPLSWRKAGAAARGSDLLVFPWVTPFQAPAYRALLAAAAPTPRVVIVHNPLPHERRPLDEPLTDWILRNASGAVVHADLAAQELHQRASGLRIVSVAMPPTISVQTLPLPSAPPYRLLFLGFVRPYKGLDVALDALAVLVRRGAPVELTVAGEFWGPVGPWHERIEEKRLSAIVDVRAGYVPDAEVARLLSQHHVVVAPYRSATQSAIVPLAHAAGRPVAATNVGGLPERVIEGTTGALAPPGDPEAFADAIERVLADLPRLADRVSADAPSWRDVSAAVIGAGS